MKLKSQNIVIYVCLLFCFFPYGLKNMAIINQYLVNMMQCFCWAGLVILSIIKKRKISKFDKYMHLFWFVFLLICLCSDASITTLNTWLTIFASVCTYALLYDIYKWDKIVTCTYQFLLILAILNLFFMFIFPDFFTYNFSTYDGISTIITTRFVSTDNNFAPFLLSIILLNEISAPKKKNYYMCWFVALVSAIKIFSATCLIGLAIFIIVKLVINAKKNKIRLKIWPIVTVAIVLFLSIYVFHIQNYFLLLIVSILGKDVTLTQRIGLWDAAVEMIKQHIIIGWGNKAYGSIIYRQWYYWYAHNLWLDILLEGGLLLLLNFAFLLMKFAKIIRKYIKRYEIQISLAIILAFMIVNLTESYLNNVYFYLPFILSAAWVKSIPVLNIPPQCHLDNRSIFVR